MVVGDRGSRSKSRRIGNPLSKLLFGESRYNSYFLHSFHTQTAVKDSTTDLVMENQRAKLSAVVSSFMPVDDNNQALPNTSTDAHPFHLIQATRWGGLNENPRVDRE